MNQSVTEIVDVLTAMPGTVAVVLGGSRAVRSDDEQSDWDLGLGSLNALFAEIPIEREHLLQWVDHLADQLGLRSSEATP